MTDTRISYGRLINDTHITEAERDILDEMFGVPAMQANGNRLARQFRKRITELAASDHDVAIAALRRLGSEPTGQAAYDRAVREGLIQPAPGDLRQEVTATVTETAQALGTTNAGAWSILAGLPVGLLIAAAFLFFGGAQGNKPYWLVTAFALSAIITLGSKALARFLENRGINVDRSIPDWLTDISMGLVMAAAFALCGPLIGINLNFAAWLALGLLVWVVVISGTRLSIRRRIMVGFTAMYAIGAVLFHVFPASRMLTAAINNFVNTAEQAAAEWCATPVWPIPALAVTGLVSWLIKIALAFWVIRAIYKSVPTGSESAPPAPPHAGPAHTGPAPAPPATPAPPTPAPATPAGAHAPAAGSHDDHHDHGGLSWQWTAIIITALVLAVILFYAGFIRPDQKQNESYLAGYRAALPAAYTPPPAPTPAPAPPAPVAAPAPAVDPNWASKSRVNIPDWSHSAKENYTFALLSTSPADNRFDYLLDGRVKLVDQYAVDDNGDRLTVGPGDTITFTADPASRICELNDPCAGPEGQSHGRKPADYTPAEKAAYRLNEYPIEDAIIGELCGMVGQAKIRIGLGTTYTVPQGAGKVYLRLGPNIRDRFAPLAHGGYRVTVTINPSK